MTRPHLELADVFKALDSDVSKTDTQSLSYEQRRVLRDIIQCRSAALGGHVEQCTHCSHQQIAYNSCRNRHCPKCQAAARKEWTQQRAAEYRVAISNQRLVALSEGEVTFRWKDYADGNAVKETTLDVREFTRRFLLHILPRAFVRIRHYGLLANRCRSERLECCRKLLAFSANNASSLEAANVTSEQCSTHCESKLCPVCRQGLMTILKKLEPEGIGLPKPFLRASTADTS